MKVRSKEHNHTHTSLNEERNVDRIISCNPIGNKAKKKPCAYDIQKYHPPKEQFHNSSHCYNDG